MHRVYISLNSDSLAIGRKKTYMKIVNVQIA